MTERTVTVRLRMMTAEWISPLQRATAATAAFARNTTATIRQLDQEMDKAARKNKLHEIAEAATGAGIAVGSAFVGIALAAARFDKAMDEVDAVLDTNAEGMDRLREAAIQAGLATQYSATQAANAEAELARAGLTVTEIVNGGLRGALSLAAAGQVGLEEAAIVTAKALNTFGLSGSQATHVADVLAAAANKSATNVHEMALASKMSSLVAAQMGLTFEQTAGALALFAQNGLAGSDGGTSLKVMLMMLAHPTKKSATLMNELGINMFDTQGKFVGLANAAAQLQTALQPLTQEQRNYAITQIFGADASRAANILYKEGAARVNEFTEAVNDHGAAARTAAQLTDNLAGDWEKLTGALETFAIKSGGGANEGLRILTQGATGLLHRLTELHPAITGTAVVLAGLTAGGLLLAAAMIKVRTQMALAVVQLQKMGPAGQKAATGLQGVTKWAMRAGVALAALQIAGAAFDLFAKAPADANRMTEALAHFGQTGKVTGDLVSLFGDKMQHFGDEAASAQSGFGQFMSGLEDWVPGLRWLNDTTLDFSGTKAVNDLKAIDDALTGLIQAGRTKEAEDIFLRLQTLAGKDTGAMLKLLPGYAAGMNDVKIAQDKGAKTALENAKANFMVGKSMEEAAAEGKTLLEIITALHGEQLKNADAQINAEEALDNLVEGLKKSKKGFEVNTEAGRENKRNLLELLDAAAQHAEVVYKQTQNMDLATQTYKGYLRRAVEATELTKEQKAALKTLIDQLGSIPELKEVAVRIQAAEARSALNDLIAKVAALKDKSIRIDANVYWDQHGNMHVGTGTQQRRDGGIVEHARMGTLRDAAVFRTGTSPLYAFAEPETRGEAFVPKNGDPRRSVPIIEHAANWYGMTVYPMGRSGSAGGGTSITNHFTINPSQGQSPQAIAEKVSVILARQANRYSRSG